MGISDIASTIQDPKQMLRQMGAALGTIGPLEVDVIVREAPEHTWDITEHASAEGAPMSTQRRKRPDILTLDCVFTDKTYGVRDIATNLVQNGLSGLLPETWRDKYSAFMALANDDSNEPFQVTTGLDTYQNMLFQSVSPLRALENAGGFFVTAVFKEIRIVSADFFDTALGLFESEPKSDDMKKKTAKKTKKKTTPKQAEPEQEASWLHQAAN